MLLLLGLGLVAGVIAALWMSGSASATPTCTIYWTGKVSTSWATAGNWSLTDGGASANGVPGTSDYVCMSTNPTRANVVSSASSRTIAGINFAATASVTPSLDVQGATFTVNTNASTINNLSVDSGYLGGTAAISMTGTPTFSSSGTATIDGTGSKIVSAGSTLEISSALAVGSTSSPALPGRLQIDGTLHLDASATLNLASAASAPGVLVNNGTMQLDDASLVQSTGSAAAAGRFTNTGTLTTGAGSNYVTIGSQFTNTGSVAVSGEALQVVGSGVTSGGSDTGTWTTSGALLQFTGGTRTLVSGSISGANGAQVSGATLTFGSNYPVSTLDLEYGTVSGSPTASKALLVGGTLTGSGTLTIASSGTATLGGSTFDSGYRLLNNGTLTDNTSTGFYPAVTNGGVIENAGTWNVTGDGTYSLSADIAATSAVKNDSGATLTVSLSTPAAVWYVTPALTNAGSIVVTTGSVQLSSGTIGSTSDTGTEALSSGTTLIFAGGTRSVSAGSVTGAGTLQVAGATVSFASGVTLSSLDVEGGTVSGSPTVSRALLNGGTLTGSGTLTVPSTGTVSFCASTLDAGYRLLNQGAMTTNTSSCGYPTLTNGGVVENAGTWAVTGNGTYLLNSDGSVSNAVTNDSGATISVSLSTPSAVWYVTPAFTNAGSMVVTSGTVNLNLGNVGATSDSGTEALSSGTTLIFAGGTRSVSAGSVTGAGTLQVAGATVSFASGVTLSSLDVEGGTVTGSPTVSRALLNGGTLTGSGTLTVPSTGTVSFCASTLDAGYRLLNQGAMTTNTSSCGYPTLTNGGVVENAGTWAVTGNGTYLLNSDGSVSNAVTNDSGATISVSLSTPSAVWYVTPAFTNAGSMVVTSGTVNLNLGNVGATSDSGTEALSSGTTLIFAGGTRSVSAGSVTGAGTLQVAGATVSFASGVTLSSLDVEGGTVTGSPTVSRALLNGGTLTGSGTLTVPSTGTVSFCASTLDAGYRLLNQGAMTTNTSSCGYPTLTNGGVVENAGTWAVTGSGTYLFNSDGAASDAVTNDAGATLSVSLSSTSATWTIQAPLTNNGSLVAVKGKIVVTALTNLTGAGTLTGGSYTVSGGTLALPNSIVKNAASVTLGATGTFSPTLTSITSNSGTLAIGQSLLATGSLTNSGALTVSGSAITYRVNSLTQTAGSTVVNAGASLKSGASGTAAVTVNGGTLSGVGTVLGAVTGPGTFSPGTAAAGKLTVTGSFAPTSAATTAVTVGPGSATTQLAVSGAATLSGGLAITGTDAAPAVGTAYTVLTAASITGKFTAVTGQQIGSTATYYSVKYTSTSVVITVTPYPSVSVGAASVAEGNSGTSQLVLPVTLSSPAELPVTVNYATADATATAGSDYTATSGTLIIPVGSSAQSVSVPVLGDTTYERNETFTLTLSAPANATIGTGSAAGTITNDDAAPVVSIGNATGTVNGAGTSTVSLPVTVSGNASALPLSVAYATSDGSAVAGTDYTATGGTLTVPAGTTSASITVPLPAQSSYQPSKSFTVTLSGPTDATIGTASATATIINTDPTVSSVSPGTLSDTTPTPITITGTNFAAGALVSTSGGDVTVSSVSVVSPTQITATLQAAAGAPAGTRDVRVTQTGSTATCAGCITVVPLSVTAITPNTLGQGGTATVTVSGTSFQSGATLTIGTGITATTTSVTPTSLTATVKAASTTTVGAKNVVVKNPNGRTALCSGCLTITSAPALTQVSPAVLGGGASQTVTLTGTNFAPGATITTTSGYVTVSAVSVVSSTQLTATFAVSSSATAAARTVTVTNTDGGVGSCTTCFSLTPGPKFTSVSPNSGLAGSTKTVTVNGSNFQSGATVSIPNATVTITSSTSTAITASVQVAANAPAGNVNVVVTNPDYGSVKCASCFKITQPPTVTHVSPTSLAGGASQKVTLTGTHFAAGATLTTSSAYITVSSVSVVSSTQLTATFVIAPTTSSAPKTLTVTNTDGGVGSCTTCFSLVAGPAITSFTPTSIARGTSVTMTIVGARFSSDAVVSAPGVTFSAPTSITSTQIVVTATVPSGSTVGSVALKVSEGSVGRYGTATKTGLTIS